MLLQTNTDRYHGKKIVGFEDKYGYELDSLIMMESLVVVLDDGQKFMLSTDWRGQDCYISQCEIKEKNRK